MRTIVLAVVLSATAGPTLAQNAKDPIEGWNRAVFGFNEGLDRAVLKPVAEGYKAIVPELVRNGVSNVFANIGDGWSAINQLLQGKPVAAAEMTMRVATNTLFGIGGLFDVATDLGIERRTEDFGQTLGRWGLPAGPYLVLPVLGPSSLRDTAALPVDLQWSASAFTNDSATSAGLTLLRLVDVRASLLNAGRLLDEIALDKYVFVRDGYLTRRLSQVYDGEPPATKDDEDEGPAQKPGAPTPAAAPASAPK
ncbi:MAG: VacJ family lipoprotein [Burkholderiaceae bacterium]